MDVQQIKLRAMALIGRYKPKVIRTFNARLTFAIARRRAAWAFLLASTWPLWLAAGLLVWPLFTEPPANMRPSVHYGTSWARLCVALLSVAVYTHAKWRRWSRFVAR